MCKNNFYCIQTDKPTVVYSFYENSKDPDQLTSDEASWSRSTLVFIYMMNLYLY